MLRVAAAWVSPRRKAPRPQGSSTAGPRLRQRRDRGDRLRDLSVRSYNVRVINLSVASGVFESYWNDPLTLAAQRAAEAGIVVVAAAGNLGLDAMGRAVGRRHLTW